MSRFTWNGALYGNLEEDPEPQREELARRAPFYRFDCPSCAWRLEYVTVEQWPGENFVRALISSHFDACHASEPNPFRAPSRDPRPHVEFAKQIEGRIRANLEEYRKKLGARELKKNKDGVYE